MVNENKFQADLVKEIRSWSPDVVVLKNDANHVQGIPDLVIFFHGEHAFLEVKKTAKAPHRPNQDYYINHFSEWGFAKFVYPENRQEILKEMRAWFDLD